jgi:serine protease Do
VNGPANLQVATLGNSDTLETGDWVMAIGNPLQLGHSVTVGVVSYVGRSFETRDGHWQKLIQTDASINPGSSGGPLLNTRGEVVGINLAMLTDGLGDAMGIGFAVPVNTVTALIPQLRAGRVVRGSLGVHPRMTLITEEDAKTLELPAAAGALIVSVDAGSSAEAAGVLAGDVIVEFNGTAINTADDVCARVSATPPGSRARIVLIRDGRKQALEVKVEPLASPSPADRHRQINPFESFDMTLEDAPAGGALVSHVELGGLAERAGLESGDILRKVNTHAVRTAAEAVHALQRIPGRRTVFLLIYRDRAEQLIEIAVP